MGRNLQPHPSIGCTKAIGFPQRPTSRGQKIIPKRRRCQQLCPQGVIRHSARLPSRNIHTYSVGASHDANLTLCCYVFQTSSDGFRDQLRATIESPRSALGQEQTSSRPAPMSALPLKADLAGYRFGARNVTYNSGFTSFLSVPRCRSVKIPEKSIHGAERAPLRGVHRDFLRSTGRSVAPCPYRVTLS